MRYLFVHQNFPGQFVHLVRHLLAQQRHDVVFIGEPNANTMPGVRRIAYRPPGRPDLPTHPDAQDFAHAMARAQAVAAAAMELKRLGFMPDIIIGHHGWGELLNLGDVWPGAPLLGYHEYFYALAGQDVGFDPEFPLSPDAAAGVRAKNAVNLLALSNPGHGHTPTRFQRETYPAWARPAITLLPEGVNLEVCRPQPGARDTVIGGVAIASKDRLVTFVARDLEPYRGFHTMMRSLPALLQARPDARVVLAGGDGVSYGARIAGRTWREHMLGELGSRIDPDRVHFPGKLDYPSYVRLLQRSDAHVYLTYPFVASWSLREALACGCALVASDTAPVREFVIEGQTGRLTPFLDPAGLAARVAETLEGGRAVAQMRGRARAWAEANLAMADYLQRYESLVARVAGNEPERRARPAAKAQMRRPRDFAAARATPLADA